MVTLEDITMLTFDAVTTYAERHWDSHAKRCVDTFHEFWRETKLRQYEDEQLYSSSDWLHEFKTRNKHLPTHNYRFDAVRFAHKVAAIELAYRIGTADVLVWIDADCVTHAPVDSEWLSGLLGEADFGYLKRERKYPECGVLLIRRCKAMTEFIQQLVLLYRTGALFELAEWHDSFAIDYLRRELQIRCASLSGDAENTGHPLVNGPLGEKLDHLKGKRKSLGKSLPTDLKVQRREVYWNG